MDSYRTIEVEQANETMTVRLNRPKLNLFNGQMLEELIDVWRSLRTNTSARFVILTARGKHFSGGADLDEFSRAEFTPEDARYQQLAGHEMMRTLENLEQITLCAMRGVVCGAGMAVAQACDFRIMTQDSYYLVPETNIGTYYTWGCTPRLVRMVGASKAMEIIMTCDPIPAEEAYRLNLTNKIVPNDALMEETQKFIDKIASKSPTCIRLTKKIALGASMQGFGNIFVCEPELMQEVAASGETREGMMAFMEKRQPRFK